MMLMPSFTPVTFTIVVYACRPSADFICMLFMNSLFVAIAESCVFIFISSSLTDVSKSQGLTTCRLVTSCPSCETKNPVAKLVRLRMYSCMADISSAPTK